MAELTKRQAENAVGPYFVDSSHISCGACSKLAPQHFPSHPLHTYAYVERQPTDEANEALMAAALALCPVQAIGKETL